MFEILFVDQKTGEVRYGITNVRTIYFVAKGEVGYIAKTGETNRVKFDDVEMLEIRKITHG